MAVRNAVQVQVKERSRCAGIVRNRRYEIELALTKKPLHPKDNMYIRRFLQILIEIESNILDMPEGHTPEKIQYPGDFSAEEMERAQAIIEEQERNPFEEG